MAEQRTLNSYDTDSLISHNQLLTEEIQRRVEQLAAINTVAAAVSQSLDLQVTLQTALDAVLNVIKVHAAGISLVDEAAGELVMRAQRGWKYDFVSQPMRVPLDGSMSGQVVRTDEILITGDLTNDPRLAVPAFAQEGVQAMALVPMHARGRVVGVLSVMHYEPYTFAEYEITMMRAIADQVGVALDNARLYESTREKASQLDAILQSSGDAIIATDNRGNISLINSTAQTLFNLRYQDMVGTPLRDAPLHPKLRDALNRAMSHQECNTAFEVRMEDGRCLSAVVSPVYARWQPENDQDTEGWMLVVQDVTPLRQVEVTRLNFVHAAAHDLRNPLGAIMGAMVMLEGDMDQLSELHQEIVSIAIMSANRMQDLIDNLLNLEQIESGIGVQLKRQNVHELVERCIVDIRPTLQQKNQTLHVDVPEQVPTIRGDMHWLYRAMMNLLGNASKYTHENGEITLRVCPSSNGELNLEVQDNGRGVAADVQHKLFERFFRAVSRDKDEVRGSGLGLSIVKSVAEQHGGRVYVQSREGVGSTFGIAIPVAGDSDE